MKNNAGLKILTAVVVSVVVLIVFSSKGSPEHTETVENNNVNEAIASQFNDNIRDVSARLIEDEKKIESLEKKNNALIAQNEALLSQKTTDSSSAENRISPEITESIDALKKEIEHLKRRDSDADSKVTYPLAHTSSRHVSKNSIKDIDALLIQKKHSPTEDSYWQKLNERRKKIATESVRLNTKNRSSKDKEKAIPYYTVPAGSDLGHTVLLSSLIGEVPNDGKVVQPLFPFSAMISRGDLMASNGVPLPPDISGMKVNGYAIGVGSFLDNISCVRAYVTSVLFTFQDGHFVVVGQESMKGSIDLVNNESLGYLTTPYGNPCIHGKYFTNAPRVLSAMLAAGGAQGFGDALSQWQMSFYGGPNGGSAFPTGNFGKYAAGGAVANGAARSSEWLEKRIQGSFDMVFVPASFPCIKGNRKGFCPNQVSLHLMKTISIDKEPLGRVLNYGHQQNYHRDYSLR